MIITKTPFRVSFVGGGTDFKDYYKNSYGSVISSTIDKYIYVTVNEKFDGKIHVRYSQIEEVEKVDNLGNAIIREALKLVGIDCGIEIVTISDIPTIGSGLGSSSALAVGLLNALYAFKGYRMNPYDLAVQACKLEIDILKSPIGKQDQWACFLKGEKVLTKGVYGDKPVPIENIKMGDFVWSFDEKTSRKELDRVVSTNRRKVSSYVVIKFSNGNQIKCTEEHPIYVVGCGWSEVKNIKIGDSVVQSLFNPKIKIIEVIDIQKVDEEVDVFNIETEKNHNYFVYGILVHNCAIGGLNKFKFLPNEIVECSSLLRECNFHRLKSFEENSMLFYLGFSKLSDRILREHKENIDVKKDFLDKLKSLVDDFEKWMNGIEVPCLPNLLINLSWEYKKQLSSGYTNESIDKVINKVLSMKDTGVKLCGAGGGGFMFVICDKKNQNILRQKLTGLIELPFKFAFKGSEIIYNDKV